MELRQIQEADIAQVVSIHKSAFSGFFLTQLGDEFLKTYYNSVRKSPKGILLGYFDNDVLSGFVVATTLSRGYNTSLIRQNLLSYMLVGLKIFIRSPKSLIRLYRNLTKKDSSINDSGEYAELLSIGVNPAYQRMGIGRILLSATEQQLKNNNIQKISLTTDYYDNESAIGFYNSMQYKIMYDFIAYPNRKMYRLIKDL